MGHAVLFVCTANICRSPMAEGALRKRLQRSGRADSVRVASAGTHNYHLGEPAFPTAVEIARARGYDISGHIARVITPPDFERYSAILAMDQSNLTSLRALAPARSRGRIELLLEYGERYHGLDVPDPYGKTAADFELALNMIEDGCRGLVELLVS